MKISVIIPVYNVEKTLEKCVNSVLAGLNGDSEIILVDDCSPDNSGALCDSLKEKDGRITVIHKEKNEGLGFARNTGLKYAHGDYIMFADSDDEVVPGIFKTLENLVSPADVTVFGVETVYTDAQDNEQWSEKLVCPAQRAVTDGQIAAAFTDLSGARIFPFAWNKLYRRAFIEKNGFLFESTRLIEDFLFNIAVFSAAQTAEILENPGYRYMKRPGETLVNSYCPEFFELCKRKYSLERAFLESRGYINEDSLDLIYSNYVKHLLSVVIRNRSAKAGLSAAEQKNRIENMLADETTVKVLADYRPRGKKMLALAMPMKKKLTGAVYLLGEAAEKAQNENTKLFKTVLRR